MPGKHSTSPFGRLLAAAFPDHHSVVRRAWMLAGAVAAATALVGSMAWVRSDSGAGPRPLMIQPGAAVASVLASAAASPPVPLLASSAGPSPRRTSLAAPPPARKSPASARRSPSAAPKVTLTATYMVGASWGSGFIVAIQVHNTGSRAQDWAVSVRYDDGAGVRIGQAWNATLTRRGDTTVLSGGPLAAGATQNLGFQAITRGRDRLRPPSCTVNGSPCAMS